MQVAAKGKTWSKLEITVRKEDLRGSPFDLAFNVTKVLYIQLTRIDISFRMLSREDAMNMAAKGVDCFFLNKWAIKFGVTRCSNGNLKHMIGRRLEYKYR